MSKDKKELLTELRDKFGKCLEHDDEQRRDAMWDMKFTNVPGYQWDENQKKERGKRPCYEFNKIRVTCKRIINNMRANRPSGKVRPVEGGDKEVAEIYEGLIRNIWEKSDGEFVADYAAEYQVPAGYGAWRIVTDYVADDMFEQDIRVEFISNPFCLFSDPSAKQPLKQDANYWILTERIPRTDYEAKWPRAEVTSFESHEFDDDEDWDTDEEVRIAEYWYKVPVEKEIWQLTDGSVVDSESDEAEFIPDELIKKRRTVQTHKIMMCIASGDAILEGPTEWAGTMFPFVPVYGEYYIIDGKTYWSGITRYARDAQKSYNVSRTAVTESIMMSPLDQYWVTPKQAEGQTESWAEAHQKNFPFKVYNPDPQSPGPPVRSGGANIPAALITETQMAAEEINMVTGIYQADLGSPNQAKSGRQEIARQQMGALATFNYEDNMAKAIQRTWELLVDLIPKIYDTTRELRVLGNDGAEDYVSVNKFIPTPQGQVKINDITKGKYDVNITVGPNFTTRRQEAAETYQGLLQGQPQMFPIIGDLVFKSMDLPYAEDIAERLKVMAPPQIQQLINGDKQVPPEVQAMMAQAQQAMQMVEARMQEVQKEANDAEIAKSEVEKLKADLSTSQAQFEAKVAKAIADLEKKKADFQKEVLNANSEGVIEASRQQVAAEAVEFNAMIAEELAKAMDAIRQASVDFNAQAVDLMQALKDEKEKKPARIKAKRVNGELIAEAEYE